jgi:CheY-like chemotaxis protein
MATKTKAHILIADDDAEDREFIISALKNNGFQGKLDEFENGELLSNYLDTHPGSRPDLILLDLNMPVKNGFDTLRELKRGTEHNNIPVIVLSASTRKEDEQICAATGCDHYLSKPLDFEGYNTIARFVSNVIFHE